MDKEHTDDEQALWQRLREHEGLACVREMAQQFHVMVHEQQADRLDPWLAACRTGPSTEMRTFAAVLGRDYDAVHPDREGTRRTMRLAPAGQEGDVWMMQMRSSQRPSQMRGTFRWRLEPNEAAHITIVTGGEPVQARA